MELTKERNQNIADLLLKPVLDVIDAALDIDGNIAEDCEELVKKMGSTLSTAQAISGLLLRMSAVDKRALQVETFKTFSKLLSQRKKQRDETIAIMAREETNKCHLKNLSASMGFELEYLL